jgi:RNA polymerase primary sigma factor
VNSAAELAKEMGIIPQKVRQLRRYIWQVLSLDQTLGAEGDCRLGDFIEDSQAVVPVDAVVCVEVHDDLQLVLTTLSEREASVIRLRYGLTDGHPRILAAIGRVYGLTRERIRQIEAATMTKLRQPCRSQVLRDYLN